jgi:hypothetical protein
LAAEGDGRILLRGRLKVKTEFSLVTLAFNLKRVANLHGTAGLQEGLAGGPRHGPAGELSYASGTALAFTRSDHHALPLGLKMRSRTRANPDNVDRRGKRSPSEG